MIDALSKVLIENQNSFIKQNEDQSTYFPRIKHEDYFDDLARHIVYDIYEKDFELFKYDLDPANRKPIGEIDLDEVHARLSSK